jgi:hypothetical protein
MDAAHLYEVIEIHSSNLFQNIFMSSNDSMFWRINNESAKLCLSASP